MQRTLLIVVATDAECPDAAVGEILVCGVGKTAAGVAVALRLADGGIDGVISFGVAGAYPRSGLALGDVVVAAEVAVLDEGLETGAEFRRFERPGMAVPGMAWTPTDPVLRSDLVAAAGSGAGFRVAAGRIGTVSVCAGTARLADERSAANVLAEGMEGAAVALAAARHGVPFVEVRGISNACGPRDGAPFDLVSAIRNANAVLMRLAAPR